MMKYLITILGFVTVLSFIPMIMFAQPWHYAVALLMYFVLQTFGANLGYHRIATHKLVEVPRWFEVFTVLVGTLTLKAPAMWWAAQHNSHHTTSDTYDDTHSIAKHGFFKAVFLIPFCEYELKPRYIIRLLKDPFYQFQQKYYWHINILFGVVLFLIDPFSLIYAWLVPAGLVHIVSTMTAIYSHRNGKANDDPIFSLLIFGEGYHKYHHDHPRAYKYNWTDISGHILELVKKKG